MSAAEAPTRHAEYILELRGPRVVYGVGVGRGELAAELDLLEVRRVLLVAGDRERDARAELLEPIGDRIVGHFTGVRRHVPVASARAAAGLARELEADCLLSIGGGSAVGTAKAVALETGLPIVALPTTYAGSEMTPIHGITSDGIKRTGRSDQVLPRTVLLDPLLSVDLPLPLTRSSAVNALAHCAGGVFAAGHSPVTDLLAGRGTALLIAGLGRVGTDPTDVAARGDLCQGAHLAGTVLAHAGASPHHSICHILGGAFDLPHAETHAAVLPAALRFLQERHPHRAEVLSDVLGGSDVAEAVRDRLANIDATVRLRDIGLAKSGREQAARLLAGGVPDLTPERAHRLLEEAW